MKMLRLTRKVRWIGGGFAITVLVMTRKTTKKGLCLLFHAFYSSLDMSYETTGEKYEKHLLPSPHRSQMQIFSHVIGDKA